MAKVALGVKVEAEMKVKYEIIARRDSVSYADAVRIALMEYLHRHEKQQGKISQDEINQILLFSEKSAKRV